MNDRLSVVAERAQTLVHHQQALHDVALLRQREEVSSTAPEHMPQTQAQKAPPVSRKTTAVEDIRNFMQLYGVVPLQADDPYSIPTPAAVSEHVQNRTLKGETLLQDLHKVFEKGAKSSLTDRELGGELLFESLLADSAAHPTKPGSVYNDTQLEGSIELLRHQVEQIENMFKDLKMDGPESAPDYVARAYRQISDQLKGKGDLKTGSPKLEEFLRKWSC